MKRTTFRMLMITLFFGGSVLNAQSTTKTLNFKKGEVLDILLFSGTPNSTALFGRYRKTAFPVATKLSYQPQPGFSIVETRQGGIQPENLFFGKWKSLVNRERFLDEIVDAVPDFHEQRRAIWSSFYLAYYEMPKDISFKIDPEKLTVVTTYWKNDNALFQKFKKDWLKKAQKAGGKVIIELSDAKSPLGYLYKPDFTVITRWENKADFDLFYKENLKMSHKGVQNVNQFIIK